MGEGENTDNGKDQEDSIAAETQHDGRSEKGGFEINVFLRSIYGWEFNLNFRNSTEGLAVVQAMAQTIRPTENHPRSW